MRVMRTVVLLGTAVAALLLCACGGSRAKSADAPATEPAPVAVPPVAATADDARPPPRAAAPVPEIDESSDDTARVQIEVDQGGGRVHLRSAPDSGVKVWGTFSRTDGGFSFQGGFSTHGDAGAP